MEEKGELIYIFRKIENIFNLMPPEIYERLKGEIAEFEDALDEYIGIK